MRAGASSSTNSESWLTRIIDQSLLGLAVFEVKGGFQVAAGVTLDGASKELVVNRLSWPKNAVSAKKLAAARAGDPPRPSRL